MDHSERHEINRSELILNTDGSIYHLGLLPEDIASTIITVGDPGRVEKISRHLDRIEVQKSKREFITHTGWLGKRRLTVISTGIGTDNIDIVVNELDALANIDLQTRQVKPELRSLDLIRLGTSGGLGKELPVGCTVQSRFAIGMDGLMLAYKLPDEDELASSFLDFLEKRARLYGKPYGAAGDPVISDDRWEQGITLSCPGFYGPQFRQLRAPLAEEGVLDVISKFSYHDAPMANIEMETSGLFGLAHLLGHRATSVSAVLANRTIGAFAKNSSELIDNLIQQVLEQLSGTD